jgi:hypothetical protein
MGRKINTAGIPENPSTGNTSKDRYKATRKRRQSFLQISEQFGAPWGGYDTNIPVFGKGAEEMQDFLRRLETVSNFPQTRQNKIEEVLEDLQSMKSKYDVLNRLPSHLMSFPLDDVILLTDQDSLKNELGRKFSVPLLHRVTNNSPSLGSSSYRDFTLDAFLTYHSGNKDMSVSVYDYTVENPNKRTRVATVDELLLQFDSGNDNSTVLNWLDIENRLAFRFCPLSILLQDIRLKTAARNQPSLGRSFSTWKPEQQEFFLLSSPYAVSTIHVDIGGYLTWVMILTGRKIWYFPRHITAAAVRWFAQPGSQTPEQYPGGWVKVELKPGDLL